MAEEQGRQSSGSPGPEWNTERPRQRDRTHGPKEGPVRYRGVLGDPVRPGQPGSAGRQPDRRPGNPAVPSWAAPTPEGDPGRRPDGTPAGDPETLVLSGADTSGAEPEDAGDTGPAAAPGEDAEEKSTDELGVSVTQVAAGALAAVTAAALGSTLGVAGTVVGAAVASVVTTVGSAVYRRSLERTQERLRARVIGGRGGSESDEAPERKPDARDGVNDDHEATVLLGPLGSVAPRGKPTSTGRGALRTRWPVLLGASVVVFVVGMLLVTGVELIRGAPLAGGSGGSSVGHLFGGNGSQDPGGEERSGVPQPSNTGRTSAPSAPTTGTEPETSGTRAPETSGAGRTAEGTTAPEPGPTTGRLAPATPVVPSPDADSGPARTTGPGGGGSVPEDGSTG